MGLVFGICALLAVMVWFLRAVLVTPLPVSAQLVFLLDRDSEPQLEYAVRGYRFLKKRGYYRGNLQIVLLSPSEQGRAMAQILARQEDILLTVHDGGPLCPE